MSKGPSAPNERKSLWQLFTVPRVAHRIFFPPRAINGVLWRIWSPRFRFSTALSKSVFPHLSTPNSSPVRLAIPLTLCRRRCIPLPWAAPSVPLPSVRRGRRAPCAPCWSAACSTRRCRSSSATSPPASAMKSRRQGACGNSTSLALRCSARRLRRRCG